MRKIVYDNILEIIKENQPAIAEQTKNGMKYTLHGKHKNVILSTFHNDHKIELFINDKLFTSAKTPTTLFCEQTAHFNQLYNIECALKGQPPCFMNQDIRTSKHNMGATPRQVRTLQIAWWKSYNTNHEKYLALGNSR